MSVQDESWDRPYCNICCTEIKYGEKQNHGAGKCDSDSTHGGIKKIMKSKKINIDKEGLNSIDPTWLYPNQVNRDYEWAYTRYKKETGGPGVGNCIQNGFTKETMPTQDEFIARIKNDPLFAQRWGKLRKGKCCNLQEQISTKKNNDQMNKNNLTKEDAQKLQEIMTKVGLTIPQEVTNVLSEPDLPVEEILCDCGLPCHPNTPCSEMIQYYNHVDSEYFRLLNLILKDGRVKKNRTGIDTIGIFGAQAKFNVDLNAFPILTTKKVWFKGIVHELLWFIKGDTNIKYLVDNDVHIWDEWAFKKFSEYVKKRENLGADANLVKSIKTQDQYIEHIKRSDTFAVRYGNLGEGTYGGMWRKFPYHRNEQYENLGFHAVGEGHEFGGVDQLKKVINKLKTNPDDRRMIVSAWHPYWVDHCALPPCHCMFHFNTEELTFGERLELYYKAQVEGGCVSPSEKDMEDANIPKRRLNLLLYQRSCDTFLGVPFNITSYCLLLAMVSHCSNMVPGTFTHTYGDLHIYVNHKEQVKTQLARTPKLLPKLWLNPSVRDLFAFTYSDIKLENYNPHPTIKAEVAV